MKEYKNTTKTKMNLFSRIADSIYQQGYEDGKADTPFTDTEEAEKKAYEQGLNDAWDAARKIAQTYAHFTCYDLNMIFGDRDSVGRKMIFEEYTPEEALAKIKAYEDKQKQDAEIKVGDEVYSDAFDDKGIVTHITTDKVSCVCIICNGFTMMKVGLCGLHKTGRHFDQIAEVLAELRGAENDEQ